VAAPLTEGKATSFAPSWSANSVPHVTEKVITSLEMTSPDQLREARPPPEPIELRVVRPDEVALCHETWTRIGAPYGWRHRTAWGNDEWRARLAPAAVQGWLARVGGEVAGYLELEAEADGVVGITFFGLVPEFLGECYGGAFLTEATRLAWSFTPDGVQTRRVWLQTSSRDHPHAFANYEARGFRVFRRERRPSQAG
jgi:GNAT superfamily N-acetyltransferase